MCKTPEVMKSGVRELYNQLTCWCFHFYFFACLLSCIFYLLLRLLAALRQKVLREAGPCGFDDPTGTVHTSFLVSEENHRCTLQVLAHLTSRLPSVSIKRPGALHASYTYLVLKCNDDRGNHGTRKK